ncbi:DUF1203 domain-containing protein [Nonomuraea sp. NPDC050328]|uniref:DUF1203 domain-containing protein n=1 Tax=Nonomuraea sp. NPDC050328 TaxID=3364361 RepID=UPI00379C5E7A
MTELLRRDDAGNPPRLLIDDEGGSPLRCCLTKAEAGAEIALVSYAPLRRWAVENGVEPGAYDEVGPVFVHAGECPGQEGDGWPVAHTAQRVLRAYTAKGTIHSGRLLPAGADPEAGLEELFAEPEVAVVHVRAVEFGCFQFAAHRS